MANTLKRPRVKGITERGKAERMGITHTMVKKIELLIHRFGEAELERMLLKLCNTVSDRNVQVLLNSGTYPIPPEFTGKYLGFVRMFLNKTGFSVHNLYDIRIKSESMFIVRAIVCYHFAITLNMKQSQVMAIMKYKFKDDIALNVGRIETALRQQEPEFMYFWNMYQDYIKSVTQPEEKRPRGRQKGFKVIGLLDRPIVNKKARKVQEWGD